MIKLVVPKFATEREEAEWWDAHMDIVESNLLEAMKNGTAGRGIVRRLLNPSKQPKKVPMPRPRAEGERASKLDKRQREEEERCLGTLLHDAIEREETSLKKNRKKTA